ncbi:hypothetical protein DDB_G0270586 [Dictyostelium discoideum AX4]|uniref:Major facilitator superfamily (MFS) profile domain-containing protein n=1 Tax=Dictyostelium discoideum TaxID=44689 RepID=Q55DK3_DICDI|nr:hypothetical protein DDB_G0270586 [Dictyostelium discoideum AX4]EAL72643.1 hypothetical protein DDB_G0270586 [Dictyostelium discoideum AX4]|eukprot:XP_646128.1 hypothetical protein DDB_G0270586 [Dictyostelium discoideum AX4]
MSILENNNNNENINNIQYKKIDIKTPLVINSDSEIGENFLTNGQVEIKKRPLKEHKYLKQIIILFSFLPFIMIPSILFQLYLPSFFTDYVTFKYPDYSLEEIQSKAAYYKSYSDSLPYISALLFGPLIGVLSDNLINFLFLKIKKKKRYGRKPIFFGAGILFILDAIATLISVLTHNLMYHYVVHTIVGVNSVSNAALTAYISDISDDDHIPILYSLLGGVFGAGIILGPLVFILINLTSIPNITLYVIVGLLAVCMVIIAFLDESVEIAKKNNKIKISNTTTNPIKLVKNLFTSNTYFSFIVIIYLLISFATCDITLIFYYYCSFVYEWSPKDNSIFFGGLGFIIIVWGAVISPILLKYFCAMLGSPQVNNLVQAIISQLTPPEMQATILVGAQSISSIASFLGSIVVNDIFMYSISNNISHKFPQFVFLIFGIVIGLTTIGTIIIFNYYKKSNNFKQNQKNSYESIK